MSVASRLFPEDTKAMEAAQQLKDGIAIMGKQSSYTREHLYNLDSDDDELDFLRKDVDFDVRA